MNDINQLPYEPKRSKFKVVVIMLIILLLGIGLYLYFTSTPSLPAIIAKPIVEEIPAVDIVLAISIDDDFNYVAQPNKEYYEGRPIFAYVEIRNFVQSSDFSIDISEDVEVKDSQNNIMFAQSKFAELKNKYDKKMAVLLLDNGIITTGWKPGNYVLNLRINDNFAKKSTMKSINFVIKKVPSNIFASTVDLSGIIMPSDSSADLIKKQVVKDSAGKVIQELNITQTINTDLSKLNLKYIQALFMMPERFDAGTYSVILTYSNVKTGGSVSAQGQVISEKKFEISDFVFAKSIAADYSYVAQPNKEVKIGDSFYVYNKVINLAQPQVGLKFNVNFTEGFELIDFANDIVLSNPTHLVVNNANNMKLDGYRMKMMFTTYGLLPGNYRVKITITDRNSGQKAVREEAFRLA